MLRAVVAATAAVTIAGSSLAYAQPREGRPDGGRRWQPTVEDVRAFQAARLAALRAGLMLTSEQERHWPAFEQAMRDIQQLRLARFTKMREARREGRPPATDPAERMRRRAERLSESGAVLKRLAEATEPLYRSLDDAQKRRFAILARAGGPRGAWRWRGNRDRGEQGAPRQRTDAHPARPQPEHAFGGKDTAPVVYVPAVFGSKVVFDEAFGFAPKAITAEPASFGGKALTGVEGVGFSRKIATGEPAGFGRKTVQDI